MGSSMKDHEMMRTRLGFRPRASEWERILAVAYRWALSEVDSRAWRAYDSRLFPEAVVASKDAMSRQGDSVAIAAIQVPMVFSTFYPPVSFATTFCLL